MEIIPALFETDKNALIETIKRLAKYYQRFQVDIADGKLVPNQTIKTEELLEVFTTLKRANILTPKHSFDFDLMVEDYEAELDEIDELEGIVKVDTVLIRAGLIKNYSKISSLYPELKIGLVLDPEDEVEILSTKFDLEKVPVIQIMSVKPGFQGRPFIEDMLDKVEHLRMLDYRNRILLDGGINEKSLELITSKKYLPDAVCIGSYLTQAGDELKKRSEGLKNLF